ncbi:hypothetical protein AAVH_11494 [Aphelenchoides avenae]|nr:hypothetical protein AAVH_11494 [Aphelenchus avenae]
MNGGWYNYQFLDDIGFSSDDNGYLMVKVNWVMNEIPSWCMFSQVNGLNLSLPHLYQTVFVVFLHAWVPNPAGQEPLRVESLEFKSDGLLYVLARWSADSGTDWISIQDLPSLASNNAFLLDISQAIQAGGHMFVHQNWQLVVDISSDSENGEDTDEESEIEWDADNPGDADYVPEEEEMVSSDEDN